MPTFEGHMTRQEFGVAVAQLLTEEQRRKIRELHDQVEAAWLDGCAAANESANCCVDEISRLDTREGA